MRILLDDIEIDPVELTLEKGGQAIEIQRQPLSLLLYLVRNRDRVVSRDELLAVVWSGKPVTEGVLSTAIYSVRRAIGDQDRREPWIRTVRGRGFRYEGPFSMDGDEAEAPRDALPLVAREKHLARLSEAAERARRGEGTCVFVPANAGMGKTRLLREFLRGLSGFRVVEARAEPELSESPLALWSEVLSEWDPGRPSITDDTAIADVHLRVRQLLASGANASPVVLALEDLHWAHPASLSVLANALARVSRSAILLIGTYRPGGDDPSTLRLAQLSLQPGVERVSLRPFDLGQVYEVLGAIRGRTATQPEVAEVLRRGEGVPLFTIQLAYELDEPMPVGESGILADALNRVSADSRANLGVASLVGSSFDVELVEAAVADEDPNRKWITESVEAGILERDGDGLLVYRFTHNLIQEAATRSMTADVRVEAHGRLAMLLQAAQPEPSADEIRAIARHFTACDQDPIMLESAIHWNLLVARSTAKRFAWEDVFVATERLMEWIDRVPLASTTREHEEEILSLHTAALASLPNRLDAYLAAARRIADRPPSVDLEITSRRLAQRLLCAQFAGEVGDSRALLGELKAVDDERVSALARSLGILVDVQAGQYREAHAAASALLDDPGPPTRSIFQTYEAADVCLAYGAIGSWMLGERESFRSMLAVAEERALRRGDKLTQAMVMFTTCVVLELDGDWASLEEVSGRLDPLCLEFDVRRFLGAGYGFGAWAKLNQGEAQPTLEGTAQVVRSRANRSEGTSFRPYILGWSGRMLARVGTLEAARRCFDEAYACARAGESGFAPIVRVWEAELLDQLGASDSARAARAEAAALARARGAKAVLDRLDGR